MIRIGYCRVPAATLGVLHQPYGGFGGQGALVEHPGSFRQGMLGLDVAAFDGQAEGSRANPQKPGRLGQVHPAFRHPGLCLITGDPVRAAQGNHPFAGPPIAMSGAQFVSVEGAGDPIVGANPGQDPDGVDNPNTDIPHPLTAESGIMLE